MALALQDQSTETVEEIESDQSATTRQLTSPLWSSDETEELESEDDQIIPKKREKLNCFYLCPECGGYFETRSGILRHLTFHTKIRFQCPKCQKSINRYSNMERHLRDVHKLPNSEVKGMMNVINLINGKGQKSTLQMAPRDNG